MENILKNWNIRMNDKSEKKCTLYSIMLMFFDPTIMWDWLDFGLMLRVYK